MSITRYLDPEGAARNQKVVGFFEPKSQIIEDSTGRRSTTPTQMFNQTGIIPSASPASTIAGTSTATNNTTPNTAANIPTTSNGINFASTSPGTTYNSTNMMSGNYANNLFSQLGFNTSSLPYLLALLSMMGGGSGGGSGEEAGMGGGFNLDEAIAEAGKYADELRQEAQGDYDYIIKWLNKQHERALGTDQAERAKFFELVANKFEEKVGQIPFDYYRRTEREKQDINLFLQEQDKKAQQLAEKERLFGQQQDFEVGQETVQRQQAFNARGLSGSGLESKKAGEQGLYRNLFVTQPAQQAFGAEKTNLLLNTIKQGLTSQRNLEDIATTARRGGNEAEDSYQSKSEGASRDLSKALAEIKRSQASEETNLKNLFNQYSLFGLS